MLHGLTFYIYTLIYELLMKLSKIFYTIPTKFNINPIYRKLKDTLVKKNI